MQRFRGEGDKKHLTFPAFVSPRDITAGCAIVVRCPGGRYDPNNVWPSVRNGASETETATCTDKRARYRIHVS